ncbi:MAG: hypothetical protein R3C26_14790 [Calditrichia bacterium]
MHKTIICLHPSNWLRTNAASDRKTQQRNHHSLNGYNIYRSVDASAYTLVGSADTVVYTDSGLTTALIITTVTAVYTEGESNPSNVAVITTGGTSEPQAAPDPHTRRPECLDLQQRLCSSTSTVGDGVSWKGQNGLYSGGLIFGLATGWQRQRLAAQLQHRW